MQTDRSPHGATSLFNIMRRAVYFADQVVAPLPTCTTTVKLVDGALPAGVCAGMPIYCFSQFVYTDETNITLAMANRNTTIVPWHHLPLLGRYGDSALSINTVDRESGKVTSFVHHTGLTSVTEHVDVPYVFYSSVINASSRDIYTTDGVIPRNNSWINVSKEPVSASKSISGVPLIPSSEFTSLLMASHIMPMVDAYTTAICITPKAAIHVLQTGTERFPDHVALLVPNLIAPDPRTGLVSSWILVAPPKRSAMTAPRLLTSAKYLFRESETGDIFPWTPEPEPEPSPEPTLPEEDVPSPEPTPPMPPAPVPAPAAFYLTSHDFPPLGGI